MFASNVVQSGGRALRWTLMIAVLAAATNSLAAADQPRAVAPDRSVRTVDPTAWVRSALPNDHVERIALPGVDLAAVAAEDEARDADGLPPRYAIPCEVSITPATHGTWEQLDAKVLLWRLRITSPGALSLNLGFSRYRMPDGAYLLVSAADLAPAADIGAAVTANRLVGPFTRHDNQDSGELWTPVVLSDDVIVELTIVGAAVPELQLELASVNHGYRFFGAPSPDKGEGDRAGSCNIDVICPQGDGWRDEIPSVGVISTGGSLFCTGFMVNNTAHDETPYFMTARHCGITSSNAGSLVVYWNFQSPTCGQQGGGSLSQYQTGSTWRSSYSNSDFTLVQLNALPNPNWEITYAGWDRTSANPTSAVAIHHPSTDEKSISFENQACTTTSYLGTSSPGDGTHVRVIDWDSGTTEPGSSGSPLFNQNHHVVGQLHGGYAACGNDESDWYGRFSISWAGGGGSTSRLSNWLDPGSTGQTSVDTLVPGASGLSVTPSDGLASSGDPGGPFTPSSKVYTLENLGSTGINYSVTKTQSWVSLSSTSGYLAGGATTTVTVSINSNANSLPDGEYTDTVSFINTTDHVGDTTRPVTLTVGGPQRVYFFPMDTNPGWTTQDLWAFGHPTGGGGQYGGPDPSNGYTGTNVYGYNLSGDYQNDLAERHLTSTALDCSNLSDVTLKFRRWLGVERSLYDHAYVRVSNNGSTWTTLWENGSEVADTSWVLQEFDLSAVADGQSTVYLRWTMGTTDESWQYCGWNIDDVEIWAFVEEPPDTTPPTPNPMTWASPPAAASASSITMTATTASDDTPPVEYDFDFVSGGSGGTDSGWQSSTAYVDSGLSPNTSYTYRVRARDSASTPNVTSYSGNTSATTWANAPAAPTLSNPTATTMSLDVNVNGNPASTEFAVRCNSSAPNDPDWVGKYVSASGTPTTAAVWRTDAQWGNITIQGLEGCTTYVFAAKARNSSGVETAFGPVASLGTLGTLGDLNGDGAVDGDDIQAFTRCQISGGSGCGCAALSVAEFVACLLDAGACP